MARMVTEPPYPLEFELTLKGDPNNNFYIDINERTARADDVKQKITEKVCETFGINSCDVQSVKFHEKRLNRIVTHTGVDDILDAHKNDTLECIAHSK